MIGCTDQSHRTSDAIRTSGKNDPNACNEVDPIEIGAAEAGLKVTPLESKSTIAIDEKNTSCEV
jgi:hypothetical protein